MLSFVDCKSSCDNILFFFAAEEKNEVEETRILK